MVQRVEGPLARVALPRTRQLRARRAFAARVGCKLFLAADDASLAALAACFGVGSQEQPRRGRERRAAADRRPVAHEGKRCVAATVCPAVCLEVRLEVREPLEPLCPEADGVGILLVFGAPLRCLRAAAPRAWAQS